MCSKYFDREYIYKFLRCQPDVFLEDHCEDFITYLNQFTLCFKNEADIMNEFYKFIKIHKQIELPM